MKEIEVAIGLTNPKSPSNVGAAMRAAGCYRVDAVYYTGHRFERARKYHTDTQQAGETIPLTSVEDFLEQVPQDLSVVCVELVEGATPLPDFVHPEKAIYVFGPEDGSLKKSLVNSADAVVYIPTVGSMNLAATVNVVLYDRLVKRGAAEVGDALIRQSRDANNKIKLRKPRVAAKT